MRARLRCMLTSHSNVSERQVLSSQHRRRGRRKQHVMASGLWAPLAVFVPGVVSGFCLKAILGRGTVKDPAVCGSLSSLASVRRALLFLASTHALQPLVLNIRRQTADLTQIRSSLPAGGGRSECTILLSQVAQSTILPDRLE